MNENKSLVSSIIKTWATKIPKTDLPLHRNFQSDEDTFFDENFPDQKAIK